MSVVVCRDLVKRFGETLAVDHVNLEIPDGEFMVFVGPSGCGKTTTLRMIGGLEKISSGEILIDGQVVNDVPPRRRDIAMVFQNYALYPHYKVFDNIAYPLRLQKRPKAEIEQRVRDVARMLDVERLLERWPRQLSGGERQRVALGRAIVRKPRLYLMDEPLSNLDAKLRVQMRREIIHLQHMLGTTMIYVTHDQVEAMTMGDRIMVMRGGKVQQIGQPEQLYNRPANMFVAQFIGSPAMNIFNGKLEQGASGLELVTALGRFPVPGSIATRLLSTDAGTGDITWGIRAEDVSLLAPDPEIPTAIVDLVEGLGADAYVSLTVDPLTVSGDGPVSPAAGAFRGSALVARTPADAGPREGETVGVRLNLSKLHLFDPETEKSILSSV